MTTQPATLTLTAFLERCLADDEAVARAATQGPWYLLGKNVRAAQGRPSPALQRGRESVEIACAYDDTGAAHIARHDPARVLAEVEAKRAIVAECAEEVDGGTTDEGQGLTSGAILGGYVLRALASVYRDRDGFDPAWL